MKTAAARLDPARLDVTVTEGERCQRTLKVAVPSDIVNAERSSVIRKYASRVKMRGFRKGRVPSSVILQRYGRAIEEEAVEASVRKACDGAIAANGLQPVSDVEVKDLRFEPGERLSFEASFDVRPEVPLGRLGGFRIERPRPVVPEGATGEILERLRKEHAALRTEEAGRPEAGDSVTVLLARLDGATGEEDGADDRQYDLVLGEGQALPDIEEAIRSLDPGGADEFDIRFPEDFPDEERRGESQRLRIKLVSRRVPELPVLDDAFAASVGDFEDLDALKARIGEDLERDARARARAELREALLHLVVEANDFEVPDSMVDGYTRALIGDAEGVEPEQLDELRKELEPASQMAVKRELLVERIIQEHDLRATAEEVDAKVDELARGTNQSRGRLLARLKKSGGLGNIERTLTEARLFEFLESRSDITEPQ